MDQKRLHSKNFNFNKILKKLNSTFLPIQRMVIIYHELQDDYQVLFILSNNLLLLSAFNNTQNIVSSTLEENLTCKSLKNK